mmetsp:Transcript_23668/g.71091  ORF Transcript_23668/g.71091 Transcript_23668/m.71091 type:complete len:241 (-) Transcript_23668:497-1219(-)
MDTCSGGSKGSSKPTPLGSIESVAKRDLPECTWPTAPPSGDASRAPAAHGRHAQRTAAFKRGSWAWSVQRRGALGAPAPGIGGIGVNCLAAKVPGGAGVCLEARVRFPWHGSGVEASGRSYERHCESATGECGTVGGAEAACGGSMATAPGGRSKGWPGVAVGARGRVSPEAPGRRRTSIRSELGGALISTVNVAASKLSTGPGWRRRAANHWRRWSRSSRSNAKKRFMCLMVATRPSAS